VREELSRLGYVSVGLWKVVGSLESAKSVVRSIRE